MAHHWKQAEAREHRLKRWFNRLVTSGVAIAGAGVLYLNRDMHPAWAWGAIAVGACLASVGYRIGSRISTVPMVATRNWIDQGDAPLSDVEGSRLVIACASEPDLRASLKRRLTENRSLNRREFAAYATKLRERGHPPPELEDPFLRTLDLVDRA